MQALLAELDPRLLIPGAAGMLPAFQAVPGVANAPPAPHQPLPAVVQQDRNVAAWRVTSLPLAWMSLTLMAALAPILIDVKHACHVEVQQAGAELKLWVVIMGYGSL